IAEIKTPRLTSVAYAVNNEETNSWNTGVNSEWFNTLMSEVMTAQKGSDVSDVARRRAYMRTEVLVSDCTTAQEPLFPQRQTPVLTSRLGYGMVIKEYGAGREANSEFFAKIRGLLDREKVRWQTHGYDDGYWGWQTHGYDAGYGGGTIAAWFAGQNMDVIDVGVGLLSMHSPFEVSSKVDLW